MDGPINTARSARHGTWMGTSESGAQIEPKPRIPGPDQRRDEVVQVVGAPGLDRGVEVLKAGGVAPTGGSGGHPEVVGVRLGGRVVQQLDVVAP